MFGGQDRCKQTRGSSPLQQTLGTDHSHEFRRAFCCSTWDQQLPQQAGTAYQHAHLVLFRDAIESACGFAESASGPFYCPGDHKVYIDLGFFQELADRFGAPGDFAQAYVLAHEIGHHVQWLLGTEAKLRDSTVLDVCIAELREINTSLL